MHTQYHPQSFHPAKSASAIPGASGQAGRRPSAHVLRLFNSHVLQERRGQAEKLSPPQAKQQPSSVLANALASPERGRTHPLVNSKKGFTNRSIYQPALPGKKPNQTTKHPHGTKSQNPTAVHASFSLITEAIPLKPIRILQSFPQSLHNTNSSSSTAPWEKPPGLQGFTWLPAGSCPNAMKPTPKERQD